MINNNSAGSTYKYFLYKMLIKKYIIQEMLREKQQHVERLLRERELERAEVIKVTMQIDRAETTLAQVKKEATQVLELLSKMYTFQQSLY